MEMDNKAKEVSETKENGKEQQPHKEYLPNGTGLLYTYIDKMYKDMFERQLDVLEQVLIITAPRSKTEMYKGLRGKVLKLGNDSLRQLREEMAKYDIRPRTVVQDIIVPPSK